MKFTVYAIIGVIIAVCGAVYLTNLLLLKKRGITALAAVTAVNETKHRSLMFFGFSIKSTRKTDSYVHTLRYTIGEKEYECRDRAGFTQPLKVGSTHLIVCDPKYPDRFEYEEQLNKNITITVALVAMAVVFAVRWFMK